MGKGIVRIGDYSTGHICDDHEWPPMTFDPNTNVSVDVFVNGKFVCLAGSIWGPHSCIYIPPAGDPHPSICGSIPETHIGTLSASSSVFINGLAAARTDDPIDCGDTVGSGSSNVIAG
jgi:uncharacterized Zn-binding protein involved in type VI secretion